MNSDCIEIIRGALEQADIQMGQCLRLLDGDEEFDAAIAQVRHAMSLLESMNVRGMCLTGER